MDWGTASQTPSLPQPVSGLDATLIDVVAGIFSEFEKLTLKCMGKSKRMK